MISANPYLPVATELAEVIDETPTIKTLVLTPTEPMKFTAEDIRRQMEASGQAMGMPAAGDANLKNLLSNMASAAQNSMLEACPVFIERLRSSPRLTQYLKKAMQDWGSEPES